MIFEEKNGVKAQFIAIWFAYNANATWAVGSNSLPAAKKSSITKYDA